MDDFQFATKEYVPGLKAQPWQVPLVLSPRVKQEEGSRRSFPRRFGRTWRRRQDNGTPVYHLLIRVSFQYSEANIDEGR